MTTIDRQAAYTGTKEVAASLRIDVARLESYLTANAEAFEGPLRVTQFRGGQSNPTYMLETPERKYVLRRKPPAKLLPSAHAVDREFKAISALYPQGFPVADPIVYCADESIAGTAFYVMSYVEGRVIWVPDMPGANPKERTAVFDAMNATLAQLHSYEPAAIGLADYGRGENYVARQVDRWSKQYRASETEKIDEMERIMEWLPAHLPPAGPVRLVHGDYRLDNMILHQSEPRVRAVRARREPQVKTFALALGAGGARGLAHIAIVEALDEIGVAPVAIAGSSIGAVIGAGYAAGLTGRVMRRHLLPIAHNRAEVMRRVMGARALAWSELLSAGFGNPLVVDALKFYDAFLGELLPQDFADLTIPFTAVTTDLHARETLAFSAGPLKQAVAASMAVPGLVRP